MNRRSQFGLSLPSVLLTVLLLAPVFAAESPGGSADTPAAPLIDPRADAIVHRMIDFGHSLKSYRLDAANTTKISLQGMNMDQSTLRLVAVRLPDHVALLLKQGVMGATVVTGGTKLHATMVSPMAAQQYIEEDAPQTVEDLIVRPDWPVLAGESASLVEWLSGPDGYRSLMEGITESKYLGSDTLAGLVCDHLRFTQPGQNWDLWVQSGDTPLAMKLVPDMTRAIEAAAQQSAAMKDARIESVIEFRNWQLNPAIPDDQFAFTPPPDAKKAESLFPGMGGAPDPMLGEAAPPFALEGLDGGHVALADYAGDKVVVLDFWAVWCGPCRRTLPVVAEVASAFKDRGVVFYAVNERESAEKVHGFIARNPVALPVLMDSDGRVGMKYETLSIPRTVILGAGFSPDLKREITEDLEPLLTGESDQTTAAFTQWTGGSASKRHSHASPPSRPIQSWPVVVPK